MSYGALKSAVARTFCRLQKKEPATPDANLGGPVSALFLIDLRTLAVEKSAWAQSDRDCNRQCCFACLKARRNRFDTGSAAHGRFIIFANFGQRSVARRSLIIGAEAKMMANNSRCATAFSYQSAAASISEHIR